MAWRRRSQRAAEQTATGTGAGAGAAPRPDRESASGAIRALAGVDGDVLRVLLPGRLSPQQAKSWSRFLGRAQIRPGGLSSR